MHQLGQTWPNCAAYVVSYLVIGVIWVNHHALFALIDQRDRVLLFENLVLLIFVTALRFPQQRRPTSSAKASATHTGLSGYTASPTSVCICLHKPCTVLSSIIGCWRIPSHLMSGSWPSNGSSSDRSPTELQGWLARWPPLILVTTTVPAVHDLAEQDPDSARPRLASPHNSDVAILNVRPEFPSGEPEQHVSGGSPRKRPRPNLEISWWGCVSGC